MKTVTTEYYTIDEHPDKEKVFDWIRNNWHDLASHCVEEMVYSLKAFAQHESLTIDYSIGAFPDSGHYVRFGNVPNDYTMPKIEGDCPLTGVCYDHTLLSCASLEDIEHAVLTNIHAECEYIYSNAALEEHCKANEYHFNMDGEVMP